MPPMPTKCTGLMSRGSFMPSPNQLCRHERQVGEKLTGLRGQPPP
jgi:hypothetical protein